MRNLTGQARMTEDSFVSNLANFFAVIELVCLERLRRQLLPKTRPIDRISRAFMTMKLLLKLLLLTAWQSSHRNGIDLLDAENCLHFKLHRLFLIWADGLAQVSSVSRQMVCSIGEGRKVKA